MLRVLEHVRITIGYPDGANGSYTRVEAGGQHLHKPERTPLRIEPWDDNGLLLVTTSFIVEPEQVRYHEGGPVSSGFTYEEHQPGPDEVKARLVDDVREAIAEGVRLCQERYFSDAITGTVEETDDAETSIGQGSAQSEGSR